MKNSRMGKSMAIGTALGVAIGAALNDTSTGIAVGVALGAGIGVALDQQSKKKKGRVDEHQPPAAGPDERVTRSSLLGHPFPFLAVSRTSSLFVDTRSGLNYSRGEASG